MEKKGSEMEPKEHQIQYVIQILVYKHYRHNNCTHNTFRLSNAWYTYLEYRLTIAVNCTAHV